MITAGIDCGAKSTRSVLMKDGVIAGTGSVLTGFDQVKAVNESLENALKVSGISEYEIHRTGGTGSGKDSITKADILVNDIKAISKSAGFFWTGLISPGSRRSGLNYCPVRNNHILRNDNNPVPDIMMPVIAVFPLFILQSDAAHQNEAARPRHPCWTAVRPRSSAAAATRLDGALLLSRGAPP